MAKIQPHWRFYDCKFEKFWSKLMLLCLGNFFPIINLQGLFCHGNHNFQLICPITLCSQSLTLKMLYIRYDQDWLVDLGDISVKMCGRWRTTKTDDKGCHSTSSPGACCSGEVKKTKVSYLPITIRNLLSRGFCPFWKAIYMYNFFFFFLAIIIIQNILKMQFLKTDQNTSKLSISIRILSVRVVWPCRGVIYMYRSVGFFVHLEYLGETS